MQSFLLFFDIFGGHAIKKWMNDLIRKLQIFLCPTF